MSPRLVLSIFSGLAASNAVSACRPATACTVCVETCLVLARPDFLWDQAFPRFKQAGQAGSFLEQLQPHILAGHFSALAPEVMQVQF